MRYRFLLFTAFCLGAAYLAVSCAPAMPSPSDEDLAATSAFETLVAMGVIQPQDAAPTATITSLPDQSPDDLPPSQTPSPTATVTPTMVQEGCADLADYGADIDVTIPDDTEVAPGASIQKIWRVYNEGSCTWTSEYELIFFYGDQMAGPASQAFTTSVIPNTSVDLSIDLTAPTTPGTYQGYWKLRNPYGININGPSGNNVVLWVKIVVPDPGSGSVDHDIELVAVDPLSGYVLSDGTVGAPMNVGDISSDASMQAFMTWIISAIPIGSTIEEVEIDFSDFNILGSPFTDLQCLRAYQQDFETLDSSDYVTGPATGSMARWCSDAELQTPSISDSFKTALENKLGGNDFQIRLQFNSMASDGDGQGDLVRFNMAILRVKYTEP